jgi:hypothetical protein
MITGSGLRDALLADPADAARLGAAGIGPEQLDAALDPAEYLGAAAEFVQRALTAHRGFEEGRVDDRRGARRPGHDSRADDRR